MFDYLTEPANAPRWQSGVIEASSTAKDTWVLGAGPFQHGTIRHSTGFAGQSLSFLRRAAASQFSSNQRIFCGERQSRFNLRDMKNLMGFTIEINRLENEADTVSRQAVADLFSGRHEVLDVLRWKEIYGRLEGAADKCADVANAVESIVVKSR